MAELSRSLTAKQDDDEEILRQYDESKSRLSAILSAIPDFDYEKAFGQYAQHIKERPNAAPPGRAEAFFSSFGSPEGHKSVMGRIAEHQKGEQTKHDQLSDLEGKILDAKIAEHQAKGQNQRALETLYERQKLEFRVDAEKKRRAEENWNKRQEVLFGNKKELETHKGGIAKKLVEDKARAIANQFKFDQKMTLKLMDFAGKVVLSKLQAKQKFDPRFEERPVDAEMEDMATQAHDEIVNYARELQREFSTTTNTSTGTTTTGTPPEGQGGGKKSRARIIAERLAAERKGK